MDPGTGSAKAELSTLPESGTFYFALARAADRLTRAGRSASIAEVLIYQ
jgi:hypothetical protein